MRLLVIVLSCAVALAGCGGDPKADPSPAPSSPTTSASPTPTPPVMPGAAKANTKAGAVAFVKYYIELINHAQATGDVDALAAVEDPGCKSCNDGRKYISNVYGHGGHIRGGALQFQTRDALQNAAVSGWTVDGRLTYGPQDVVQPTATPPTQHLDGGGVPVTVIVRLQQNAWIVADWTRAQ